MSLSFSELQSKNLPENVWSLIQRGLDHAGFYEGTFMGRPGPKTEEAYEEYIGVEKPDISEPKWMTIARREIGTKEFSGTADNPEVVKYLKSVDTLSRSHQRNDETPWCSAFVNWCMEEVDIEGTESAAARSWLNWGKKLSTPTVGCVVVLWRKKRSSFMGHVGFFVKETSDKIFILGGNQSDAVNIKPFSKNRLLGYRTI